MSNVCTTGAKINGELFLELEEDEEFLKELNLSPAFKRLVKKKAKEVDCNYWAIPLSNGTPLLRNIITSLGMF